MVWDLLRQGPPVPPSGVGFASRSPTARRPERRPGSHATATNRVYTSLLSDAEARPPVDDANSSPAGRQRVRVGYAMLEATDVAAQS
jgi:hypothetical protein